MVDVAVPQTVEEIVDMPDVGQHQTATVQNAEKYRDEEEDYKMKTNVKNRVANHCFTARNAHTEEKF